MNDWKRMLIVIRGWIGFWVMNPIADLRRLREARRGIEEGNRQHAECSREYVAMLKKEGVRLRHVERH